MHFFHYPGCSTCRKAAKQLVIWGYTFKRTDLVAEPPSVSTLRSLHRRSGLPLKRFFNVSGVSYRSGGFKDRLPTMSEDEQLAALAADGKLIKRPILDLGDRVLVGFKAPEWEAAFEARRRG